MAILFHAALPLSLAVWIPPADQLINAENESRRLSYAEVLDQSTRLAEVLRARGVGPGDLVTICSENSIEYVLPVLATLFVGAACGPLSYNYTPLLEALQSLKNLRQVLVLMPDSDGDEEQEEGFEVFSKLLNSVPTPKQFRPYVPKDPSSNVALVMCSSGTTGLPKGVELTQTNALMALTIPQDPKYDINNQSFVYPGHLPMFHAFGLFITLGGLTRNFSCVVMPFFSPHTFFRIIQDYKASILIVFSIPAVPPLVQLLTHSEMVSQYNLSSLRHIGCGAAPLSAELQDAVLQRLSISDIRQGYGLTECTLVCLMVPNGRNKPGTSGCVIPGLEAKVIDVDTGRMLGPHERGELCFRGVLVMKGYKNNPEATAQTIDKEGWLHTGDVGYYDEDESFFVVDRIKELIKYKGFQVPPAELEGVLQTHPGVVDAAVVGVPNAEAGELPLAFVVRKNPAVTEKELIEFVAKNVSPQKRLRGGVRFIEAIPKNPSGKILRRDLRQLLQSKIYFMVVCNIMALRERRILRGAPLTSISRFSLPQYLYYRLKNGGSKPLVINAENESRRLSYAEVLDQSTRLVEVLLARGVGPGDLVTVCSENSIEYVLPLLASMFIRATCVLFNFSYTSRELQHLLHITPPRVVFCTAATKDNVLDALRRLQHQGMAWPALLVLMPDFNGVEIQLEGFHTLSQVLKSTQFSPKFRPIRTPDPSTDVALIMCSSGTTGLPKAVQLTQTNVLVNLAVREHRLFIKKERSPIHFAGNLPMFHGIGMMMLLGTISRTATLVVMPFYSLKTFLRIIQDYKINTLRTVPPILHQMAHSDLVPKYDLSSLTMNVSSQKRLRGGVKFVDSIPKSASGKILRRELSQTLQSKL
ncbi:hypothetical protein B566_EDAN002260 [Ephemera danica]|nr:hypothetical protein B566_EDAN002260 [Ephemera danica]